MFFFFNKIYLFIFIYFVVFIIVLPIFLNSGQISLYFCTMIYLYNSATHQYDAYFIFNGGLH